MDYEAHRKAIEQSLEAMLSEQTDTHAEVYYQGPEDEEAVCFDHDEDDVLHVLLEDEDGTETRRYRVRVVLEPVQS